ncbi:MAG: protein kinase [Clostridia bacterium]|nr:protein kinase [Clostridia bacterium]
MDKYLGVRLDNRYEIREVIGVGGMAIVYKAYDRFAERNVAVKILKDEFAEDEEFRRRFKNESKAIAMFSHPNIVSIYDVGSGDGPQYIVMEYINGITLQQYIDVKKVLPLHDAIAIMEQTLKGIQHAHERGVVHRDLKPQNIMLLEDGTVKVTDFGIARMASVDTKTMSEMALGSVHYISPEQASGNETDFKADIYSLGAIFYVLTTGQFPFDGDTPVSIALQHVQKQPDNPRIINDTIPIGVDQIIMKAMQKAPEKRFASAADMMKDIQAVKNDPDVVFDYDLTDDSAKTRYFGKIKPQTDKQGSKVPSFVPILIAITAVLVIVAVVLVVLIASGGGDNAVVIPDFKGKYYSDVVNDTQYTNKFVFVEQNKVWSDEYEEGQIISQQPKDGTEVNTEGYRIYLTVSKGIQKVEVPDVAQLSFQAAKAEIQKANLTCVEEKKSDDDVPEGLVIGTNPKSGTPVKIGEEITVYVSTGPSVSPVDVVNVIGLTESEAEKKLKDAGLDKGVVTTAASEKAAGTVIAQNPDKGTLNQGDKVDLTISDGTLVIKQVPFTFDVPEIYKDYTSFNVDIYTVKEKSGEKESVLRLVDVNYNSDLVKNGIQVTFKGNSGTKEWVFKINEDVIRQGKVNFDNGTVSFNFN